MHAGDCRLIRPHEHDLGDGFTVRRLLPQAGRRSIGPFVFFDHMGPVRLPPGQGMDVRPHPHIGLATVTWLFEGCIRHRDSLGSDQDIRPGELNWMIAGHGIVHSERSPQAERETGARVHGIQTWLALPAGHEETAPAFHHYGAENLPRVEAEGVKIRVMAGEAWGVRSPVPLFSPTLFAEVRLQVGAHWHLPEGHDELGLYVVDGTLSAGGTRIRTGEMAVFGRMPAPLLAQDECLLVLVGGAPLDGPRIVWWNFVARDRKRIRQAGADWKAGRFGTVPGDDEECIPLPEGGP